MFDFTKLWDKAYLFGPNPLDLTRSDFIFFWCAIGFVVISVVSKIFAIKQRSGSPQRFLYNRFFHLVLTMGILIFIWVGARRESIPWIETHFLVLLLFAISLVWFAFIFKYFTGQFRRDRKIWKDEETKRKYLRNT
jgi:hypothetical protein